jgi:hypothetical protein
MYEFLIGLIYVIGCLAILILIIDVDDKIGVGVDKGKYIIQVVVFFGVLIWVVNKIYDFINK